MNPRQRRDVSRALLPFAVLALMWACPALAQATTVDFETPALSDGTTATDQFSSEGVTFGSVPAHGGQGAGSNPLIRAGSVARSGTHALNISTNDAEFPVPSLEGEFATTRHQVSIYLRNITSGSFSVHMQLQLYDAEHNLLATSGGGTFTALASTDVGYTQLTASTTGDVASFWVVTDGAPDAQGQIVIADDLSFDDPAAGTPAISLSSGTHGVVVVHQAGSASAVVRLQRLNGSDGNVTLSTASLPFGVTATAVPTPVPGTADAATLTFNAGVHAQLVTSPIPITITGTPGPGAGGAPSSTTIDLEVLPYPPGDVAATGLEVNQAIQTTNDAIPLVGDKETAVRLYVRGVPDAAGPWSGVGARLTVGSHTYTPENAASVTAEPSGSNRNTLVDSFLFILSPEDTLPGRRTLSAHIILPPGRPESNAANDSVSTTVTFGPSRDFELYGFTYADSNPTLAEPPWSDFEAHRQYMLNVHPLSGLAILHLPGDPQMSFDNSSNNAYITAHNWLNDEIARLYPTGTVTGYLMTPESTGYNGWCCSGFPNWILRGQDLRVDPGPTLAHEASHRWGLVHTFEDPHYPRPTGPLGGPLGPQVGVRFEPNVSVVPGEDDAGNSIMNDMMSYTAPFWVSPYNYCNLLSGYTAGSLTCTAAAKAARAGSTTAGAPLNPSKKSAPRFGIRNGSRRVLEVAGIVYPTGKATFGAFQQIRSATRITTPSTGSEFTVELRDRSGKVVGRWGFDQFTKFHSEPVPVPFSAFLPDPGDVHSIVLRHGAKIAAHRLVSRHFPRLEASALGVKVLKGRRTIRWTGNDLDRQQLTYSVEYSWDRGATWIPLAVDLHRTSVNLDFGLVPISTRALLRVTASDGVNTTYARVPGTYDVPGGSPRLQIAVSAKPTVSGASTVLQAQALDSDGGAIFSDSAYTWSTAGQTLGQGRWMVAILKPGAHKITLRVRDRFNRTATKSVMVQVS